MTKENFTTKVIDDLECTQGKKQSFCWDLKTPGLGLRVTRSGAKSYIFESKLNGKSLRITIGDIKTWALGKAQKEARRLMVMIDGNQDPRQVRDDATAEREAKQEESNRKVMTLGDAWPIYLAARKPKWSERHYRDHVNLAAAGGLKRKRRDVLTIAAPLAALMPLKLSDLTPDRLAAWLVKESSTRPTNAALSYRLLRAFIRWADGVPEFAGLVKPEAYSSQKVKEAVPRTHAKDGDSLQREQLPLWFDAVIKIINPVIRVYLQGLLLTGARREELAGLKWDDVDFTWRSLTIRDKVDGLRIIPLTPYLAHIMTALPRRNEWIFSSPSAVDGRLSEPRPAHVAALADAGLPHLTIHGLRRSFGTLCEWVEMPASISAQIMGHKPSALAEKHYRRRPIDLLRKWHDLIEVWILEQAGIKFEPVQVGLRVVESINSKIGR